MRDFEVFHYDRGVSVFYFDLTLFVSSEKKVNNMKTKINISTFYINSRTTFELLIGSENIRDISIYWHQKEKLTNGII